jgi:hypothetical protein
LYPWLDDDVVVLVFVVDEVVEVVVLVCRHAATLVCWVSTLYWPSGHGTGVAEPAGQ